MSRSKLKGQRLLPAGICWNTSFVILFENVFRRMSCKPCSLNNMIRHMNEEHADGSLNLLWREPLREKMECDNESRVRIPIREMESNLVGVENLLLGGFSAGKGCRN